MTGTGGSGHVLVDGGRESSVFMTGLSLELRGSCVVSTVAAAGIPSVMGLSLSRLRRVSWDERGWNRHDGVEAGSGCDDPVGDAAVSCREPESLVPVVVKGSVAHRKYRRRGEHPGRAPRVRPLSPTPQGNHWNNGISLEQAIDSCWDWAGGVKL